ncbi:MAG: Ig-like domain-containing protein [Chlorobi bacterium]|nr:Ig-like domain-containing protein [Chlorobiota bacterium]
MKKNYYRFIFSIIYLISSCAQTGTLTGGEKDTEPPEIVKSIPPNKGVNFSGDEIAITFDEFFVTDNLSTVFLSSPPLMQKPDFKIRKKTLLIKLNEPLKDTVTYTFLFGDAVKDFHEGNKISDFKFIFSTGNKLDTMEVSGKVVDAKTHNPSEGMFVMLYLNRNDSVPVKEKPDYIAKTDTAGLFKFDFIKKGKYKIFALKDNDFNLKFNLPEEKIAFIDSFIVPEVETKAQTDTLKAGTVLHDNLDDAEGDTLTRDTVIVTNRYIYLPENILLFSFKEDNKKQYILNSKREKEGKCVFEFAKNADSVKISGLGFDLNDKNSFVEKQDTGKTVIIWLKDKNLFTRDTLNFTAVYFNKDSPGKPVKECDTLNFDFDRKADTLKKYIDLPDVNTAMDSFACFVFETETPILNIDTAKIHLFELKDTLTEDTRKQELLEYYRPSPDTLIFALRRPFVNDFYVSLQEKDSVTDFCKKIYSETDTLLTCVINNPDIYRKDTLKLILNYDNKFFRNQIQHFKDTLTLTLLKQSLISFNRPAPDTLVFEFKKPFSAETFAELVENNPEIPWYKKIPGENKKRLILKITNKQLAEEDTLMLKIRTLDYDNTNGDKIYFEYIKNIVFKHKRQRLKKAERTKKEMFILIFNKPLTEPPEIRDIRFNKKDAFEIHENNTKDTLSCIIKDKNIIDNDTLKISVFYKEYYKNKITEHKDTLDLIYKKIRRKHRRRTVKTPSDSKNTQVSGNSEQDTGKTKQTVNLEIPVSFKVFGDSVNERKINIKSSFKGGTSYILKLDSLALEDYYGNYSQNKEYKIEVRSEEDYGNIILSLSGVKHFASENFYGKQDTLSVDSAEYSVLEKGQIIMNLYDENKNLIKKDLIKKDTTLTYENMVSGNYTLEFIFDENENKKYDTGNYFKHRQPERIIYFPDNIIIKPGWDNAVDIKFKELNKI